MKEKNEDCQVLGYKYVKSYPLILQLITTTGEFLYYYFPQFQMKKLRLKEVA